MDSVATDVIDDPHALGQTPLAEVLPAIANSDSVLANSIRRVTDAAHRPPQEVVAAFNNFA